MPSIPYIFEELRYYEDRARAEEVTRDTRLATLVALSGAVLGLLAASLPGGGLATAGVVCFCLAVAFFVSALLVATQFALRLPFIARKLGGRLEPIKEVSLSELDYYLTSKFQQAAPRDLQRRVLPAMGVAIGVRRRNITRKDRSLDTATWLIAGGILAAAAYAAILVL